jgi:hypothetical protein
MVGCRGMGGRWRGVDVETWRQSPLACSWLAAVFLFFVTTRPSLLLEIGSGDRTGTRASNDSGSPCSQRSPCSPCSLPGRLAMLLIRAQQSNPMPCHALPSNPIQAAPVQAGWPPPFTIVVCCLLSSLPLWTRTLSLLVRVTARGPRASRLSQLLLAGQVRPPRLFSFPPFLRFRLRLRLLLEAFHQSAFLDVSPATTRCRVPPCSCVQPSPHSLLTTHYSFLITHYALCPRRPPPLRPPLA